MFSFIDYFSDETIIGELCRARVRVATKRHEAAFLNNIARSATPADQVLPTDWGNVPLDIFPPRRAWHRFRAKHRGSLQAADINFRELHSATIELRLYTPQAAWARKLQRTLNRIRQRVISDRPFRFRPPAVIPIPKDAGGHLYRPLAVYPLEDKIIEGLTARYFRTILDGALLASCMAFRCSGGHRSPPTTHDALAKILAMQGKHSDSGLYVAECDIKGFFDCVTHAVAKRALTMLITDAVEGNPTLRVHSRAIEIFNAYLQSYSFLRSVRGAAQRRLQRRDPQGVFKWHEQDLKRLHRRSALPSIGVPQGGALLCLVANAVLHQTDKAVAELQKKTGGSLLYLRYCDDMILLSSERQVCTAAFLGYRRALKALWLPAHQPRRVTKYTKNFGQGKSNHPYHWSACGIPWIQFVGYQVRYDGVVRIRPRSIKKHSAAVTEFTNRLLVTLRRANRQRSVRRTSREIQHRFRQKLISMAVGRIILSKKNRGPMALCWAAGFRGLVGQTIFRNHLKVLDRHRERQIQRVKRELARLSLPHPRPRRKKAAAHKYYGRPFSYWAQFP